MPPRAPASAAAAGNAQAPPPAGAGRSAAAPEPVFQFVCRLNRMKRSGRVSERFEAGRIRYEAERVLAAVEGNADAQRQGAALDEVRPVLRALVDVVLLRGGFEMGRRWSPLGPRGQSPDAIIYEAASGALREANGDRGRLSVIHTCLALTADVLQAPPGEPLAVELLARLDRRLFPAEELPPVCPDAYAGVFGEPIVRPLGRQLRTVTAVAVTLLLLGVAVAVVMNVHYARDLDSALTTVVEALRPAADAAVAPGDLRAPRGTP